MYYNNFTRDELRDEIKEQRPNANVTDQDFDDIETNYRYDLGYEEGAYTTYLYEGSYEPYCSEFAQHIRECFNVEHII